MLIRGHWGDKTSKYNFENNFPRQTHHSITTKNGRVAIVLSLHILMYIFIVNYVNEKLKH